MRLPQCRTPLAITVVMASAVALGAIAVMASAAGTGCRVDYVVGSQWPAGFGADVKITNLGEPISSWTLTWSFTAGQTVNQAWNATVTQAGGQVTAVNADYNGFLGTNASTSFGFNGTWNNSANPVPSTFTLNGSTCTGAPATTSQATPTTAPATPTVPPTSAAAATTPAATGAPVVTRTGDSQLDARAIFFVSYDGLVNNESFQQSGILTHAGYQYAAWYNSGRTAILARRQLPGGAWQTLALPHQLSTDDSHNVISLGVSPGDGRLHVAMDTHNSAVYYVKSEAGLVSEAGSRTWVASRFGAQQRTLDGVDLGAITYPQFMVTPDGRLQLSYRTGGSGNGTNELAEYNGSGWSKLGRWQSATGSYTLGGVTSTTRNMYLHGIGYGRTGRLYATFTWREGNTGVLCNPGGLTNHDTGYVYSDDSGRSWRNNAGQLVGTTGSSTQVSITSTGLVVDPLDVNHGLMNQESQDIDSAGNPHAIISYVPGRFTQCVTSYASDRTRYARPFHVYRDAGGSWHKMEIPVALNASGRSQIVFDAADNAYVVMPFGRIVTASKASGWTDWTVRFDGSGLNAFGEVVVDRARVEADGILSVMYQQASSGGTPSALRVVDFQLG